MHIIFSVKDVGGNTVYIDAATLSDLSPQLTQQELESLVGFQIPVDPSHLPVLQESSEGQVSCYVEI